MSSTLFRSAEDAVARNAAPSAQLSREFASPLDAARPHARPRAPSMGPARTHRVFRGVTGATASATATPNQREHAELISIQPLDYESWLAAWSGNEGEDPLSTDASRAATCEELARVRVSTRTTTREDACAICLTAVRDGAEESMLPCGHAFHRGCVDEWFSRSKCCPQCRRSLAIEKGAVEETVAVREEARGTEIPESSAPTPANIAWTSTSDGGSTETSELERRERYRSCMWILHELRRDFELVLRREIVENADGAEAGAERIKRVLAALREHRER